MKDATRRTIEACRRFIDGREDALSLPEGSARFCHAMVLASGAKRCLEIGTSYGYSGLWIGSAAEANGGSLITIDHEQHKSDVAAAYFADAGLSKSIECRTGEALEVLETLEGPFDFVLNDADKGNVAVYVENLMGRLCPGAVILTDNVTSHKEVGETLLPVVRNHASFFSSLVAMDNGLEMSVYLGG